MSKASDLLYELVTYCTVGNWPKKPGAIIERLSKQSREELAKLTSEDAQNMRPLDYYDKHQS